MESRYSNVLTIILVIAIVLIIGILAFFGYKVFQSNERIKKAEDIVEEFDRNTGNEEKPSENEENTGNTDNTDNEENQSSGSLDDILGSIGDTTPSSPIKPGQSEDKYTYINGYRVIGTLSIPSIDVQCPI